MKVSDLFEGAMKRSDPYISGEKDGARPIPTEKRYSPQIVSLAKKANTTPDKVEAIQKRVRAELDMTHPDAWRILIARVQRELGLRE